MCFLSYYGHHVSTKPAFQADRTWEMGLCFLLMNVKFSFPFTGGAEVAKDTAESGSPHLH